MSWCIVSLRSHMSQRIAALAQRRYKSHHVSHHITSALWHRSSQRITSTVYSQHVCHIMRHHSASHRFSGICRVGFTSHVASHQIFGECWCGDRVTGSVGAAAEM